MNNNCMEMKKKKINKNREKKLLNKRGYIKLEEKTESVENHTFVCNTIWKLGIKPANTSTRLQQGDQ